MKFEVRFERVYPHPPEKVWRALVDPSALGDWLMETDFAPEVGREFHMWCDDGAGGRDTYRCVLLEYGPPTRLLWSWQLEGDPPRPEMRVDLRVDAVAEGAKVTIVHSGDLDADSIENYRRGWPSKLDRLAEALSGG